MGFDGIVTARNAVKPAPGCTARLGTRSTDETGCSRCADAVPVIPSVARRRVPAKPETFPFAALRVTRLTLGMTSRSGIQLQRAGALFSGHTLDELGQG